MKPQAVDSLEFYTKNYQQYIFEVKYDGGSSKISKNGNEVLIFHGKNPNPQNMKYPDLIPDILTNVKDGEYIAELCVLDKEGVSNFTNYMKRQLSNKMKINFVKDIFPVVAVFHDIVKNGSENVNDFALMDRKKILEKNIKNSKHIQLIKYYEKPDEIVKQKDVLEGVVIKKRDSPYVFGKRQNWFKFRFNTEETVKCTNYEDTETGIVLITEDGRRVNLAGDRSEIAKHKIMNDGCVIVEIAYHERTMQGFRFTSVKRVL
jgi:ATP-dependent DNA ligase